MRRSAKTWCSSRNFGLVLTPHRATRAPFHRYGRRGPQRGLLIYFYCREDGCNPASPPAHRCSGANHQHPP
jgi:hypothetical protein